MAEFVERYINPFTDYGFKKIFETVVSTAEIAKFNPDQVRFYEESLKYSRDAQGNIMAIYETNNNQPTLLVE